MPTGGERAAPRAAAEPRSKLWLERQGRVVLSDWRVELLEAVERSGSLAAAAEAMGVPYRTAWSRLRDTEDALGFRLLDSSSGGAEGGGSALTAKARDAIARYRRATAGIAELFEERFRKEFPGGRV